MVFLRNPKMKSWNQPWKISERLPAEILEESEPVFLSNSKRISPVIAQKVFLHKFLHKCIQNCVSSRNSSENYRCSSGIPLLTSLRMLARTPLEAPQQVFPWTQQKALQGFLQKFLLLISKDASLNSHSRY